MTTKTTARTYVRRMQRILDAAPITEREVEAAAQWYPMAGQYAAELAGRHGLTLEAAACVISAFSPRVTWQRNVELARLFCEGEATPGLSNSRLAAEKAVMHGFDALTGPKTNAFARAIAGDEEAVVIDTWMCKAAGLDRDAPSTVQYRNIAQAVRTLARRHGLAPSTMQALLWGRVRGSMV